MRALGICAQLYRITAAALMHKGKTPFAFSSLLSSLARSAFFNLGLGRAGSPLAFIVTSDLSFASFEEDWGEKRLQEIGHSSSLFPSTIAVRSALHPIHPYPSMPPTLFAKLCPQVSKRTSTFVVCDGFMTKLPTRIMFIEMIFHGKVCFCGLHLHLCSTCKL